MPISVSGEDVTNSLSLDFIVIKHLTKKTAELLEKHIYAVAIIYTLFAPHQRITVLPVLYLMTALLKVGMGGTENFAHGIYR